MLEYNKKDDDWKISSKVKIALKIDPIVGPYIGQIKIGTLDRVCHLIGTVPSDDVKAEAERAANSVFDLARVENELQVVH